MRDHIEIIREKQRYARIMIDQLNQALSRIQPELYSQCASVLRYVEDLLRYFTEQESLLEEMSARYEATSYQIDSKLEDATEMIAYLF